jgi:transcriptional regulator with XRE-family HTH domain
MLESMPKKQTYPQQELANRLQVAMEESGVNLADLARACGVTIQAVHGWRETGRIGKHHLVSIAQMTKKPLEYFLVGLGRAAVLAFVTFSLLLLPAPSEAATLHKILHAQVADFLHIVRKWLRAVAKLHIFHQLRTVS